MIAILPDVPKIVLSVPKSEANPIRACYQHMAPEDYSAFGNQGKNGLVFRI
jgi:hypothetical protein